MSESTTVSLGLPRPRTALSTETGSLPAVSATGGALFAPRRSPEVLAPLPVVAEPTAQELLAGDPAEDLDAALDDLDADDADAALDDLDDDDADDAEGDDDLSVGDAALELALAEAGADAEANWQERALCAQTDPESFFPEKGGSTREAKRVCMSCEVRVSCLEYALENDERFGIWGGLSERERRRVKRRAV